MNSPTSVWLNCNAATMQAGTAQPYGLIEDAALVVNGSVLQWVGSRRDLSVDLLANNTQTIDAKGALINVLELPMHIISEVTYTEPGIKGDTATNSMKAATIATGAEVKVPLFIDMGEIIKIDTRTGVYVERVKK